MQPLYGRFAHIQDTFDQLIKKEKQKQNRIKCWHSALDIAMAILILVEQWYYTNYEKKNLYQSKVEQLIGSCFDIVMGLVLAVCVYYLQQTMKTLSNAKSKSCLLVWHIINAFTAAIIVAVGDGIFIYMQSLHKKNMTACEHL